VDFLKGIQACRGLSWKGERPGRGKSVKKRTGEAKKRPRRRSKAANDRGKDIPPAIKAVRVPVRGPAVLSKGNSRQRGSSFDGWE